MVHDPFPTDHELKLLKCMIIYRINCNIAVKFDYNDIGRGNMAHGPAGQKVLEDCDFLGHFEVEVGHVAGDVFNDRPISKRRAVRWHACTTVEVGNLLPAFDIPSSSLSSVQFSSISPTVLRRKVSERSALKMSLERCSKLTATDGRVVKVSSRQLELRWRSSAFRA